MSSSHRIKRFRLKPGSEALIQSQTKDDHDATYICEDVTRSLYVPIYCQNWDFSINIGFPDDLSKWNDFDYVLVLDEESLQPYTPFYDRLREQERPVTSIVSYYCEKFQNEFVDLYNETMSKFGFLEEITD